MSVSAETEIKPKGNFLPSAETETMQKEAICQLSAPKPNFGWPLSWFYFSMHSFHTAPQAIFRALLQIDMQSSTMKESTPLDLLRPHGPFSIILCLHILHISPSHGLL